METFLRVFTILFNPEIYEARFLYFSRYVSMFAGMLHAKPFRNQDKIHHDLKNKKNIFSEIIQRIIRQPSNYKVAKSLNNEV